MTVPLHVARTIPRVVPLRCVAIVGAGPAGLMAAEVLSQAGCAVDVFDAMPSAGRKFLLAGKGGLNLTHSESMPRFGERFGARRCEVEEWLAAFGPARVREWALGLGVPTFVGSSGRVFPHDLKAAPLLRAWLHRLRAAGVRFHMRHRWAGGFGDRAAGDDRPPPAAATTAGARPIESAAGAPGVCLRMVSPAGEITVRADVAVLALGGASWARLGSDGAWVPWLERRGVPVHALRPSNCGFDVATSAARAAEREDADPVPVPGCSRSSGSADAGGSGWSRHFRDRFAGQPLKTVALSFAPPGGPRFEAPGEFVATATGIEGSLVYAACAALRDHLAAHGAATLQVDLLPGRSAGFVHAEVARPRGSRSMSTHLKSRLGLDGIKAALLHELLPRSVFADPRALAGAIKALPLTLAAPRPLDEAISTAGGVALEALDEGLMLRCCPGVFCAGEMLDWEAPTGGYLLTACLASGAVAGRGVLRHLGVASQPPSSAVPHAVPNAPANSVSSARPRPTAAGVDLPQRPPAAPG